ncbi:hypothetical protein DICVIV_03432 [Dictyocaulus viviparus]|uniref:RRM domain-containing protein n=1 Tax=Dictyocaulus viviparus TaxID=29172 RepID=A0A0D8Y756_DICVI|nr:hypothetical protein DICVIV_03432 [Dictyocaulus viviparus]
MVVVIASPPHSQPRCITSAHIGREMGRESRHVYVSGLPETISDDRINSFFSTYGRVHQIERTSEGVVVSFMDVRSAQKAHAGDHRLESGIPFRIAFHEPDLKNGIVATSSMSTTSNGNSSPKSMPDVSRKRTPSPRVKDVCRSALQRVNTNSGKRLARSEVHKRDQGYEVF